MGKDELSLIMREFADLPLRDVVFRTLRRGIHRGLLVPGERLIETQLAERLGVSRTPIREAIRMLELEGLVVMLARRGAVVSTITSKSLNDVLEVRQNLETFATGLACSRITETVMDELQEAETRFLEAVDQDDIELMAIRDKEFHDTIYKAADNEILIKLIANMQEQMYRYRLEYLKDKSARRNLINEHGGIVAALRARDRKKAEETAARHVEGQRKYILELIGDQKQ